jgi:hypothetical protein
VISWHEARSALPLIGARDGGTALEYIEINTVKADKTVRADKQSGVNL